MLMCFSSHGIITETREHLYTALRIISSWKSPTSLRLGFYFQGYSLQKCHVL